MTKRKLPLALKNKVREGDVMKHVLTLLPLMYINDFKYARFFLSAELFCYCEIESHEINSHINM